MVNIKNNQGLISILKNLGLCLCASALLAGCASTGTQSRNSYQNGEDLVTESDETDSRRRARLRLELASSYFQQGQNTVALDQIKQSLAADSNYPGAYNLRGLVYMRLNDMARAEESFRRALSINSADADVMHNYGWLLCEQQRYPEATKLFTKAIEVPSYLFKPKSLMALGLCQARAGQHEEAEQNLKRSYEMDAGNPVTAYNLAEILYKRGDYVKSQFYIRRLNNSPLANAQSLWLGIKIERKRGDGDAMLELVRQLKKRFATSTELTEYEQGRFDE